MTLKTRKRFRVELCDNVGVVDSFVVSGSACEIASALCKTLQNKWAVLVWPGDIIRIVRL